MSLLDTQHKKKSFTITVALLSLLILLLFYVGLTYMDPPEEKGIAVNFGTMDFGSGNQQPTKPIRSEPVDIPKPAEEPSISEPVKAQGSPTPAPTEQVVTQDNEESIRLNQERIERQKAAEAEQKAKAEAERIEREKQEAAERLRKEQEAKKKKLDALMGGIGKSDGEASGSEGDDNKAGDKGSPDGNPYATSYYGTPGNGTGGYGLNGRSLVSKGKVQQECNEEGRVVVQITVDRNGKVIKATPGVRGTTNANPCLLEPARRTAMMHKWNLDGNAPAQQVGFVVVNFKLGQ